MQIAIVGLGLMGGSMGYALRGFRDCTRIGMDIDKRTCEDALRQGAADRVTDSMQEAVSGSDLVIFCLFPHLIEKSIKELAPAFKKGAVVTELGGLKRGIAQTVREWLPGDVDYIGIHPMAGREVGGFVHATSDIFTDTGFIITPCSRTRPESIALMRDLAAHIGAVRIAVADAETHDAVIAYSSDLMHIAAAALCMDFPAQITRAFTAGAFRDCTRIANIDPVLWSELLMDNRDDILPVLDQYIENLRAVRDALSEEDSPRLHNLLSRARAHKKELDAR